MITEREINDVLGIEKRIPLCVDFRKDRNGHHIYKERFEELNLELIINRQDTTSYIFTALLLYKGEEIRKIDYHISTGWHEHIYDIDLQSCNDSRESITDSSLSYCLNSIIDASTCSVAIKSVLAHWNIVENEIGEIYIPVERVE
jgi:hypothetical protein